jgi:hypothetical protein
LRLGLDRPTYKLHGSGSEGKSKQVEANGLVRWKLL